MVNVADIWVIQRETHAYDGKNNVNIFTSLFVSLNFMWVKLRGGIDSKMFSITDK